jgi:hypothetical protein
VAEGNDDAMQRHGKGENPFAPIDYPPEIDCQNGNEDKTLNTKKV